MQLYCKSNPIFYFGVEKLERKGKVFENNTKFFFEQIVNFWAIKALPIVILFGIPFLLLHLQTTAKGVPDPYFLIP